jgi:hypothetical protein
MWRWWKLADTSLSSGHSLIISFHFTILILWHSYFHSGSFLIWHWSLLDIPMLIHNNNDRAFCPEQVGSTRYEI